MPPPPQAASAGHHHSHIHMVLWSEHFSTPAVMSFLSCISFLILSGSPWHGTVHSAARARSLPSSGKFKLSYQIIYLSLSVPSGWTVLPQASGLLWSFLADLGKPHTIALRPRFSPQSQKVTSIPVLSFSFYILFKTYCIYVPFLPIEQCS